MTTLWNIAFGASNTIDRHCSDTDDTDDDNNNSNNNSNNNEFESLLPAASAASEDDSIRERGGGRRRRRRIHSPQESAAEGRCDGGGGNPQDDENATVTTVAAEENGRAATAAAAVAAGGRSTEVGNANHGEQEEQPIHDDDNEGSTNDATYQEVRIRSRKQQHRHHRQRRHSKSREPSGAGNKGGSSSGRRLRCCRACINTTARLVLWSSVVALFAGVVWYSYELHAVRKEAPHRIAWLSAGAFVLLGFPISMWGIIKHLANFNQPHVQVYVVRILFMVPIYSIESWLAMRFYKRAVLIETLRDFYEAYVLYSFLQYLIQVLGGEEALVLMLKDKSPTRGHHMWGLQWCIRPWLMGTPVRKTVYHQQNQHHQHHQHQESSFSSSIDPVTGAGGRDSHNSSSNNNNNGGGGMMMKRVHWTSPFFIRCKFGVLQYVLLKFASAAAVMVLELNGWYREGDFSWTSGYFYVCIVTNVSQCWALYCLILFYYATKTELSPIRPVPKFLSVKALVFFTWWQSLFLSIMAQANMIPRYSFSASSGTSKDKTLLLWTDDNDGNRVNDVSDIIIGGDPSSADGDYNDVASKDVVAKVLQDYLICIEMFFAAVVHIFAFPHDEYSPQAVEARDRALHHSPNYKPWNHHRQRHNNSTNNSAATATVKGGDAYYKRPSFHSWRHNTRYAQAAVHAATKQRYRRLNNDLEMTQFEQDKEEDGTFVSAAEKDTISLAPLFPQQQQQPQHHYSENEECRNNSADDSADTGSSAINSGLDTDSDHHCRSFSASVAPSGPVDTLSGLSEHAREGGSCKSESMFGEDDLDYAESSDRFSLDHDQSSSTYDDMLPPVSVNSNKPGFVGALLESAIPRDLGANTVGIVKGEYGVEKKSLLQHATVSDQYDLFSPGRRLTRRVSEADPRLDGGR